MSDFLKAIQSGVSAAQQKEEEQSEILSIVGLLDSQIKEFSKNTVEIALMRFLDKDKNDDWKGFAGMVNSANLFVNQIYRDGIGARVISDTVNSRVELAQWSDESGGYPCIVTFGDNEYECYDKKGLEDTLSELMAHPDTGKKILRLMNSARKESK